MLGLDGTAAPLVWVDARFGNQDLAYRRSTDAAATWQNLTFLVKAVTVEKDPTLVMDGTTMMIAWSDLRFGNQDLAYRRSTNSGVTFDGLTFLVKAPTDDSEPVISVIDGLGGLLTWVDERSGNKNISFRRSNDGGSSFGAAARLVNAPTDEFAPACDLKFGPLNPGADGIPNSGDETFAELAACVWVDTRSGEPKPHARHSLDGGMTWLSRFEIDP